MRENLTNSQTSGPISLMAFFIELIHFIMDKVNYFRSTKAVTSHQTYE